MSINKGFYKEITSPQKKDYIGVIESIKKKKDWIKKIKNEKILSTWSKECGLDIDSMNMLANIILKLREVIGEAIDDKYWTDWCFLDAFLYKSEELSVVDSDYARRDNGLNYTLEMNGEKIEDYEDMTDCQLVIVNLKTNTSTVLIQGARSEKPFFERWVMTKPDFISSELKMEWLDCLACCEAKDIQPWTNKRVRNYFHPSLYAHFEYSEYGPIFQWLPADVKVSYDSDDIPSVEFLSPINNLPSSALEPVMSKILSKFIPLFNTLMEDINKAGYYKLDSDKHKLRDCQFIIKAQKISLDSSNPEHPEGSLHLEGTEKERILATGIYYFKAENIAPTKLHFKVDINEPKMEYIRDNNISSYYDIGSVDTKEDLCIVFPNFLYHKVGKVALEEPHNKGSREILVFWLVAPDERIKSTADVEPLHHKISYEEACIYRELLMKDRKGQTVSKKNEEYCFEYDQSRDYSLCEH